MEGNELDVAHEMAPDEVKDEMLYSRLDLVQKGIDGLDGMKPLSPHNFVVINLQDNRLRNLDHFATHPYLVELDLRGNKIDSLLGLSRQRSLKRLFLRDNPIATHPYHHIMALLVVGFSLIQVDDHIITPDDRSVARRLGAPAALAVSCGWLLDFEPRSSLELQGIIEDFKHRRAHLRRARHPTLTVSEVLKRLEGSRSTPRIADREGTSSPSPPQAMADEYFLSEMSSLGQRVSILEGALRAEGSMMKTSPGEGRRTPSTTRNQDNVAASVERGSTSPRGRSPTAPRPADDDVGHLRSNSGASSIHFECPADNTPASTRADVAEEVLQTPPPAPPTPPPVAAEVAEVEEPLASATPQTGSVEPNPSSRPPLALPPLPPRPPPRYPSAQRELAPDVPRSRGPLSRSASAAQPHRRRRHSSRTSRQSSSITGANSITSTSDQHHHRSHSHHHSHRSSRSSRRSGGRTSSRQSATPTAVESAAVPTSPVASISASRRSSTHHSIASSARPHGSFVAHSAESSWRVTPREVSASTRHSSTKASPAAVSPTHSEKPAAKAATSQFAHLRVDSDSDSDV